MKTYIDEMLHLTADIAEELLTIKDTDSDVTTSLRDRINCLAKIAAAHAEESDRLSERIEEATDRIIKERPQEKMAEAPVDTEKRETDVLIEHARREAMESENETGDAPVEIPAPAEEQADEIAVAAEFEETSDACSETDGKCAAPKSNAPLMTGKQLRAIFSLNDIFLYRRVLFGGSAAQFDHALDYIATLGTTDEVRAYLADSCHINLKSRESKDFLALIGQFFIS